jgi:YD repeat-containing protein
MKVARLWILLGVMLAGSFPILAQTAPNLANGMPPQGSYDGSSADTVNLMNGNLTLHIPLPADYPQRGKLGIKYYLVVNAKSWAASVDFTAGANQWNPTTICTSSASAAPTTGPCGQGPVFVSTASFGMTRGYGETTTDGSDPVITVSDPRGLTTWDGSGHGLVNSSTPGTFVAADTSGYRVIISGSDANGLAYNAVVIDRDGTQYSGAFHQDHGTCVTTTTFGWPSFPGSSRNITCSEHFVVSSITDANGNVLTAPLGVPDIAVPKWNGPTIATHEAVGTEANGCLSSFGTPWVAYLNYPAPNGVTNQIKLCFAVYPQLATSFSPAGIHQFQDDYGNHAFPGDFRQPFYLSSVILPDNTQWVLSYDSYGEITSVTTPGGAELQYAWAEGQFPTTSSEDLTTVSRAVHTRTVTDANGHSSVWTYQWGTQAQDGTVTHTVTDPNNNDTVHVFQSIDLHPTTFPFNLKEITTLNYQGTGGTHTLSQQVDTTWLISAAGAAAVPTDKKTTIFPSQKTSLQHTDYDPSSPILGLVVSKKKL